MILQKAFLRKSKTKIYIRIFTSIITVIFLLCNANNYFNDKIDELNYAKSSIIMIASSSHTDLFTKEEGISTYYQSLFFSKGDDNDIISTPKLIEDENSPNGYVTDIDYSKLNWNDLIYSTESFHLILTLPSSYCHSTIKDNEVILALKENINYQSDLKPNYLNQKISFNYNDEKYSFNINSIIESETFNYICLSDTTYNKLLENEKNNTYLLIPTDYHQVKNIINKWQDLEDNDLYNISSLNQSLSETTTNQISSIEKLITLFKVLIFLSSFIFAIITIFIINDLISEEIEDIKRLKQIGYNKTQNLLNNLKNFLILDLIIILISLIISSILNIILNIVFNFNLSYLNIPSLIITTIFLIIVEVFQNILIIKKY